MSRPNKNICRLTVVLSTALAALFVAAQPAPQPAAPPAGDSFLVTMQIDATKTKGDLHPIWRVFSADEPNYADMKDGRKLVGELGHLPLPHLTALLNMVVEYY